MTREPLTTVLAENEHLLAQCFTRLAVAATQTASVYLEIAERHRKNRAMLEQLRDQPAPTAARIPELEKLALHLQKVLTPTDETNSAERPAIDTEDTEPLPALTREIARICRLPDAEPATPAALTIVRPSSGRKTGYTKTRSTNLSVSFADGTTIQKSTARDVFVDALKKMGMERVRRLGITTCGHELVSERKSENKRYAAQQPFCEGFYIFTYTSTEKKRDYLEKIARRLGESITVDIITD